MALSESPQQMALREFGGEHCSVCSSKKMKNQSFCSRCYYALPKDMQRALLFEADGSAWKLQAVANIARKLSAGLTGATVVS